MKDNKAKDITVQGILLTADRVTLNGLVYTDKALESLKKQIELNKEVKFNHQTIGEIRKCSSGVDGLYVECIVNDSIGIDLMKTIKENNKGLKNEK